MEKTIDILSIDWFSEYEGYASINIDGHRIDRVRIVAKVFQDKPAQTYCGKILVDFEFFCYDARRTEDRVAIITADTINGRVIRVLSSSRIEIDIGFLAEAYYGVGFPINLEAGEFIKLQGFFSVI